MYAFLMLELENDIGNGFSFVSEVEKQTTSELVTISKWLLLLHILHVFKGMTHF